jgi:hypothetical protein
MKCKGCGFPFPPHELREDHCFECVWKRMERVEKQTAQLMDELRNSTEFLQRANMDESAEDEAIVQIGKNLHLLQTVTIQ